MIGTFQDYGTRLIDDNDDLSESEKPILQEMLDSGEYPMFNPGSQSVTRNYARRLIEEYQSKEQS